MPEVWRARLGGLDPRAEALNHSLPFDRRLWPEELTLTRGYAVALVEAGMLDDGGARALLAAADALERELASGAAALAGEDVHSAVEAALAERCGEPARRLHTGRSRNDQVATLLRMRVMRLSDEAVENVRALERALVRQARASGARATAAATHLQPAQPVRLGHLWLAHAAAFERDEARFESAREAADSLPLGAGAVTGTPLQYDRLALAARLGFSRVAANSVDAVGDRDFALEYLNAAAVLGVHLSRLAEDLVLWCSPGFGWFAAPDGFSTGSSLLPQKRNPDLFELARGKSARLIANAQRLAIVLKGLPSAYQKDLQEDKEAVFDTADTLDRLLAVLPDAIAALEPRDAALARALTPDLLAVELADALVAGGVPFRDAHAAVGRLWAEAERAGVAVDALPDEVRLSISPLFTAGCIAALSYEAAIERRGHEPGTGSANVEAQLERFEARLGTGAGDVEASDLPAAPARKAARPPAGGRTAVPPGVVPQAGVAGSTVGSNGGEVEGDGLLLRRATLDDVQGIARVMADYVQQGVLLPRAVSELYQCIREFHVAVHEGEVVACAALRLLWHDLGEVRSLAVHPDHHGRGLGARLVERTLQDARALGLPRVIALTREVAFFERAGFAIASRDTLPRKVWTDCVRCPRRHACDEVAVVLDLVPGASAAAGAAALRSWVLPIPPPALPDPGLLPIVS
jgi:argininosuccinate lyase